MKHILFWIWGSIIGGVMAHIGFPASTWQFWTIMISYALGAIAFTY